MRRVRLSIAIVAAAILSGCGHAEDFSGDRPDPSRLIGAACDSAADCEQSCVRDRRFPGGFCTIAGCRTNVDCPDGSVCVRNEEGMCALPCAGPLDCTSSYLGRSGYTCLTASGFSTENSSNVLYRICMAD